MPVLIAPAVTVAFKLQIKTTVRLFDSFVTPDFSIAGSSLGLDDKSLWSRVEETILFEVRSALLSVDMKCRTNELNKKARELGLKQTKGRDRFPAHLKQAQSAARTEDLLT